MGLPPSASHRYPPVCLTWVSPRLPHIGIPSSVSHGSAPFCLTWVSPPRLSHMDLPPPPSVSHRSAPVCLTWVSPRLSHMGLPPSVSHGSTPVYLAWVSPRLSHMYRGGWVYLTCTGVGGSISHVQGWVGPGWVGLLPSNNNKRICKA